MSLIINTEKEYRQALKRMLEIFDAKPNTNKGSEFELLMDVIENYENTHYNLNKLISDSFRDQF